MLIATAAIAAAIAAYWTVGRVRVYAERRTILDVPNERSSHCRPIPRGGGLGIVLVTCGGLLLAQALWAPWPPPALLGYLAGGVLVAAVSWIDDLRGLPPSVRLLAHGAAALLAIAGVGGWDVAALPGAGALKLGWLGLPLAFIWVVGMINACNFMDGIDGLAGGQTVVASLGWAILGWLGDNEAVLTLAVLLGGSSLGFLGHNWPPARIFMGDVGSTFLGYSLAVVALLAGQSDPRALAVGVFLLWPFLFDAAFTLLRRLRRHENIFAAHRTHLYQRLAIAQRSHLYVTRLYLALAAAGLVACLLWRAGAAGGELYAPLLLPGLALGLVVYTWSCEQAEAQPAGAQPASAAVDQREPLDAPDAPAVLAALWARLGGWRHSA